MLTDYVNMEQMKNANEASAVIDFFSELPGPKKTLKNRVIFGHVSKLLV